MPIGIIFLCIFEPSEAWRKPSNKVTFQHIRFFVQAYPNNLIGSIILLQISSFMLWQLAVGELSHPSIYLSSLYVNPFVGKIINLRNRKINFIASFTLLNQSFQQKCFLIFCFLENSGRTSLTFQRKTDWLKHHEMFRTQDLTDKIAVGKKNKKTRKKWSFFNWFNEMEATFVCFSNHLISSEKKLFSFEFGHFVDPTSAALLAC